MVTLIHKEDWDTFSASVSSCPDILLRRTLTIIPWQDPFPEDIVWGKQLYDLRSSSELINGDLFDVQE